MPKRSHRWTRKLVRRFRAQVERADAARSPKAWARMRGESGWSPKVQEIVQVRRMNEPTFSLPSPASPRRAP